jgi:hypothetical protein
MAARRIAGSLLLVLAVAPPAAADGKIFAASRVVASIPDQEALIHFKDGVQTLAIETRFIATAVATEPGGVSEAHPGGRAGDGDSTDLAWVVPVPGSGGTPVVAAASRGLFPTLRAISQPRVVATSDGLWRLAAPLSFLFLVPCCLRLRALNLVALTLLMCFLAFVGLLPSLGRARSALPDAGLEGVRLLDRSFVGAFDVAIIAPDSTAPSAGAAAKLAAWLRQHGFALDAGVEPILADYASRGWVFVASRLRAPDEPGGRRLAPHPLVVTFRTPEPVYPLVLTGSAGEPLTVDLYVFGEGLAEADGFRPARCAPAEFIAQPDRLSRRLSAPAGSIQVAHDDLRRLVPASATFTRLSATLSPEQMRRDAVIRFGPARQVGGVVYSFDAAAATAVDRAALALLASSIVLAVVIALSGAGPARGRAGAAAAAALAAAIGLGWYIALPKARTERIGRSNRTALYDVQMAGEEALADLADARRADPAMRPTVEWVRARVRHSLAGLRDRYRSDHPPTMAGPIEEDSPFNYLVREGVSGGTVELVWFDALGVGQEPVAVFE